jgi:hypothetical protein
MFEFVEKKYPDSNIVPQGGCPTSGPKSTSLWDRRPRERPLFDHVAPPASCTRIGTRPINTTIAIPQIRGQRRRAMDQGRPKTEMHQWGSS